MLVLGVSGGGGGGGVCEVDEDAAVKGARESDWVRSECDSCCIMWSDHLIKIKGRAVCTADILTVQSV